MTYSFIGFAEPFSSWSHLLAALVCLVASGPLLARVRGRRGLVAAFGIFCFACVFLLSMSGVFHLLSPTGCGRQTLQRLDHAAIFVLIAGTFTPIHVVLFRGFWRWGPLALIWTSAIACLTLKTIYFRQIPEYLSVSVYLGMGWIGAVTAVLLIRRYGVRYVRFLFWGALAYTAGALIDFINVPTLIPGVLRPHEIFHIAILFGIGYHWRFISMLATCIGEDSGPARGKESVLSNP